MPYTRVVHGGRDRGARSTRAPRNGPRPAKGQAASNGYREAKRLRARAYEKVARQRQDTGRKWARKVVRDHDAIAVEGFRPRFLAKSTMAHKAAEDQGLWSPNRAGSVASSLK
ncbi:hypothetical protein QF032_006070 [Streptomyces achromogenes]|uniref:Probable transposase IS891/IS1136/IS1341 domain-containing protein n=1 Tax=Streptomyces achromogenes TaxID=67255 RepID=A0ABU0Q8W7_STRAH|nr:hypothetical protein [Streptomyces achromogenes]MDQ0834226.1 hypothetical protein [Streptomyces achromogenes]